MTVAVSRDERDHARLLGLLIALTVVPMWLVPLREALWVDELLTHWIVAGGIGDVIPRATDFHNASPLYFLIAWVFRVIGGGNEIVMRLPSLAGGLLGGWLLFRLGFRLFGSEAARIAVLAYAAMAGIAFAAGDARPYALAIASLIGSLLALVRWIDERRTRDAVVAAVSTALVIWLHFFFALALLAHLAVLITRRRDVRARDVALLAGGCAVLLAPLVPQLASIASRRGSLTIPQAVPTFETLATLILPAALVLGTIMGLAIVRAFGPLSLRPGVMSADAVPMLVAWGLAAPLVPFVLSQVSETRFSAPRYYFFTAPAFALALGWAIAAIGPARARRIICAAIVVLAILSPGSTVHSFEDWRAAAERVAAIAGPGTLVLLDTHLVEARDPEWLTDPVKRSYVLAPLLRYPMTGRIVALPYDVEPATDPYLATVAQDARDEQLVVLVQRRSADPFRSWLEAVLGPAFTIEPVARIGQMTVDVARRN